MKIIAVRPLKGIKVSFLNNLKIGEFYYFSSEYKLGANNDLIRKNKVPDNFFCIGKTEVNVSAIVGKNGSGKSSVIELFLRIINNVAHEFFKSAKNPKVEIKRIEGVYGELIFKTEKTYRVSCKEDSIEVFSENGESGFLTKEEKLSHPDFKGLFYSIIMNYSHYAYNPVLRKDEVWLDKVFHKNDGYQTPLVLNPFRKDGNIDINTENHLVHARLMTNLIKSESKSIFNDLLDQLEFNSFSLKPIKQDYKRKVIQYSYSNGEETAIYLEDVDFQNDTLWDSISKKFNIEHEVPSSYLQVKKYLIYKAISIYFKYYNNFTDTKIPDDLKHQKPINRLVNQIYEDKSHITLKFKQAANLLRYKYIDINNHKYSFKEYFKLIKPFRNKGNSYIELLPPAIFNTKIFLKSKTTQNTNSEIGEIEFETLSSGQKQQLYSISSILYHISNLESVSTPRGNSNRVKYSYVNVVLEEIELYSHPEMQRVFLRNFLKAISEMGLKDVKSINIIIVTHSPFILSDIPLENVLLLSEGGTPYEKNNFIETFGANIHDLLYHNFFLNNGAVGAFAQEKLTAMIKFLNNERKDAIKYQFSKDNILDYINLIGEPFLKDKLMEMYDKKFGTEKRIKQLEEELKRLKGND